MSDRQQPYLTLHQRQEEEGRKTRGGLLRNEGGWISWMVIF